MQDMANCVRKAKQCVTYLAPVVQQCTAVCGSRADQCKSESDPPSVSFTRADCDADVQPCFISGDAGECESQCQAYNYGQFGNVPDRPLPPMPIPTGYYPRKRQSSAEIECDVFEQTYVSQEYVDEMCASFGVEASA